LSDWQLNNVCFIENSSLAAVDVGSSNFTNLLRLGDLIPNGIGDVLFAVRCYFMIVEIVGLALLANFVVVFHVFCVAHIRFSFSFCDEFILACCFSYL
jgi:hypothetical protein